MTQYEVVTGLEALARNMREVHGDCSADSGVRTILETTWLPWLESLLQDVKVQYQHDVLTHLWNIADRPTENLDHQDRKTIRNAASLLSEFIRSQRGSL